MILYKQCPICTSADLRGYSMDTVRNGPHISRVICGSCAVVFANPMADQEELKEFYSGYYHKGNMALLDYTAQITEKINQTAQLGLSGLKKEASYIYDYKQGGRFLDVGCGLGIGLLYVNQPSFELYATELDAAALRFVADHFKGVKGFQGELTAAHYPDEYFDYVYCNHVIEHVLDPVAYIKEMFRVLKKGGILYIGTPNRGSNFYRLYRTYKLLRLSVPQIIDGIEHTFIFSQQCLASLTKEAGFEVARHKAIPLGDSFANIFSRKMPLKKKVSRYVQTLFNVNQELICRKP